MCARYRRQVAGGRESRGLLRYSDTEWALIVEAARVSGMRPGAWVQHVAHEAARRQSRETNHRPTLDETERLLSELREQRRVLTNIGGNVNALARAAHATGHPGHPASVDGVLRVLRRVVLATDEVIQQVRKELPR